MKNKIIYKLAFFVLILFSCSGDDSEDKKTTNLNGIDITYLSYWESVGDGRSTSNVFDEITIRERIENISENEQVNVLEITARSSTLSDYIVFSVIKDKIGPETLFNNHFNFIVRWPTYNARSSFQFNVTTNNENELIANFQGELEHWNNNTNIMQVIDVSLGLISIKF